jgi:hypothetical protein
MVRPVRVELTTYSSGGCRSIHLSYGRTVGLYHQASLRARASDFLKAFSCLLTAA